MSTWFGWLITLLTAASLLLGMINTVWVWLSKPSREQGAKIDRMDTKLIEHDRRVQSIESELKHMPSRDDVAGLRLSIAEMNGQLNTTEAELASVGRTVRRIEEHLLGVAKV